MKHETCLALFRNSHIGEWYKFSQYPNYTVTPDTSIATCEHCDNWKKDNLKPSEIWFCVTVASGSDYSGDAVNRANWEEFKQFECNKVRLTELYAHGNYELFIRGDLRNKNILEILSNLEDYPLIEEEKMSEIEIQWQNEHLAESWTKEEIASQLEEHFGIVEVDTDSLDKLMDYCLYNGIFEWEYCGTGATLILCDHTFEKIKIHGLINLNVVFSFPLDFDFYSDTHPDCLNSDLMKALAFSSTHGYTYTLEDGSAIELPSWAFSNNNQLPLI